VFQTGPCRRRPRASARGMGRMADTATAIGIVAGGTGILLLFLGRWIWRLPLVFLDALGDPPLIWNDLLAGYFVTAFLMVFAPALLMGLSLHIAPGMPGSTRRETAYNGLVAVVLGLLAAFMVTRFLPGGRLSLATAMTTASWICVVAGLLYLAQARLTWTGRLAWMLPLIGAAVLLGVTQPRWSTAILARGIYTMPVEFKQVRDLGSLLDGGSLMLEEEDRDRIVTVDRLPDAMTIRVNGSIRASAESGMIPHLLTGHIPLLLSKDPRKVFLAGLDGGLTLRAIEAYPVDEIRCVEPSASVIRAAGLLSVYNGDALNDTRLSISVKDIGNELLCSANRYDIVILKSPLPYSSAGEAQFTSEFFSLVRSRLAPGGIVCQQINTFEFSVPSLKSLTKTFAYYFPHVTVWWVGGDKILLLGSSRPMLFSEDAVLHRMSLAEVQAELARLKFTDPFGILSCFIMRRDNLMAFAGSARLYASGSPDRALDWAERTLQLVRTDGMEEIALFAENPVELLEDMDTGSPEYKALKDRLDRCVTARQAFTGSLISMREGRIREAVGELSDAPALCPLNGIYVYTLADYYIVLSRNLLSGGRLEEAVDAARRAVELLPLSPRTFYNLASIELTRDPGTAAALLERATQLNPYYIPAYLLKAEAELASGRAKDAAESVGEVLTMEPFNMDAHHLRGLSLTRRRMYAEGRAEFQLVLDAEPGNLEAMEALAYNWLLEENLDKAESLYRRILKQDPDHLGALNNYATILAEKERYREAVEIWTKALELSPGNTDIIDNIEEARGKMRR
jgi:tetratricopeptide (TPR) repeat protein/spermidine synthase